MDMTCACLIKGKSQRQSCSNGLLTEMRVHSAHRMAEAKQSTSGQMISCISRTVIGQPGHSLLQDSMPDDEDFDCAPSKRKALNWTPFAWLNSLEHRTGFSTSEDFNKERVLQDWTSFP
jgi:hypothetical protein